MRSSASWRPIAIPQYQDYVVRSRWQDTYTAILPIKAAIGECAQNNSGDFANAPCATIPDLIGGNYLTTGTTGVGKFGTTVAVTAGAITMDGSALNALGNCVVTLSPALSGGGAALAWTLNSTSANCGRNRIGPRRSCAANRARIRSVQPAISESK